MLAVLLPGALSAQVFTSRTHLAAPPSRFEVSLSYGVGTIAEKVAPIGGKIDAGDWEITVRFNPATCEIYCSYRRKSARSITAVTLPPPLTEIRVFMDSVATPLVFVVDPAGVGLPTLTLTRFSRQQEIDQRKIHSAHLTEQRSERLLPPSHIVRRIPARENFAPSAYSLRI